MKVIVKQVGIVGLIVALILAKQSAAIGDEPKVGEFPPTMSQMTPEEAALNATYGILIVGLEDAAILEGHVPSLPELCMTPYLPVRCSDLKNPYTGAPFSWKEGEVGEISLTSKEGDYAISAWSRGPTGKPLPMVGSLASSIELLLRGPWVVKESPLSGGRPTMDQVLAERDKLGFRGKVFDAVRSLSYEEKAAYFVGLRIVVKLETVTQFARAGRLSLPSGKFSRLSDFALAVPAAATAKTPPMVGRMFFFLDRYRNEFSGGYARQVDKPDAGNYSFDMGSDGTVTFMMFGKDGAVLVSYVSKPGGPSSLKNWPYPDRMPGKKQSSAIALP